MVPLRDDVKEKKSRANTRLPWSFYFVGMGLVGKYRKGLARANTEVSDDVKLMSHCSVLNGHWNGNSWVFDIRYQTAPRRG